MTFYHRRSLLDVQYFNTVRTTLKTKGMTSVEYRNHTLVV
ncbi:IS3 family transposase [Ligilactobacillus aviarius]